MARLSVKQAEQKLIKYALTYPEAVLEHPWDHDAVKVKGNAGLIYSVKARAGRDGVVVWGRRS